MTLQQRIRNISKEELAFWLSRLRVFSKKQRRKLEMCLGKIPPGMRMAVPGMAGRGDGMSRIKGAPFKENNGRTGF